MAIIAMPLIVPDRVLETTTTVGTGSLALAGAVTGYNSFSSGVGANNTCFYVIDSASSSEWEIGVGTLNSLGTTLARTSILSSSNGNTVVNLSAGTKRVYTTYPANFVHGNGNNGNYSDSPPNYTPGGRLTLSGVDPIVDNISSTNLYYLPYMSDLIYLTNSTGEWRPYTFTSISLAMTTTTSGNVYDVFVYDNAGTLTLELSTVFTGGTTRVDALTLQDGVYVKSSNPTRLWLGTIRKSTTTQVSDHLLTGRFVWNAYNRIMRSLSSFYTSIGSTPISASPTISNVANLQLRIVCGSANAEPVTIFLFYTAADSLSLATVTAGIGVNQTAFLNISRSVQNAAASGSVFMHGSVSFSSAPSLGYSFYAFNASSTSANTVVLGSTLSQGYVGSGMQGVFWC